MPSCIGITFEAAREVGRELDGRLFFPPTGEVVFESFLSTGFLAFLEGGKIGRHDSFWKHMLKASVVFFEVEKWNIAQNRRS